MANILLDGVSKIFGSDVVAVDTVADDDVAGLQGVDRDEGDAVGRLRCRGGKGPLVELPFGVADVADGDPGPAKFRHDAGPPGAVGVYVHRLPLGLDHPVLEGEKTAVRYPGGKLATLSSECERSVASHK